MYFNTVHHLFLWGNTEYSYTEYIVKSSNVIIHMKATNSLLSHFYSLENVFSIDKTRDFSLISCLYFYK